MSDRRSLTEQLRELGESVPHDCLDDAIEAIEAGMSDRVAAQGVRDLLDGKLTGPPIPGTLADRVNDAINKSWREGIRYASLMANRFA